FIFFFQAEDGIRDGHVTGVQTCALPIWSVHSFADQSVRLSLGAAFESPGYFFQIDHHRDHAQIEARGGFARLPRDAFSWPLFNSLRNLGDIEQSGIIRTLTPSFKALSPSSRARGVSRR